MRTLQSALAAAVAWVASTADEPFLTAQEGPFAALDGPVALSPAPLGSPLALRATLPSSALLLRRSAEQSLAVGDAHLSATLSAAWLVDTPHCDAGGVATDAPLCAPEATAAGVPERGRACKPGGLLGSCK